MRVTQDLAAFEAIGVRLKDVSEVLGTTPKFLASGPIDRLRVIQREFAAMPVASCSMKARTLGAEALDFSITSLVRLLSADADLAEYAQAVFRKESVDTEAKFAAYRAELERLKTCAPLCDFR